MSLIKPINQKFKSSKIIHVDMDCFYASVEIRDRPELKNKPVAVAGNSDARGVITTCNYAARKYGIKSAMPSITAKKLCPKIIFLPVNMEKYRKISSGIHKIFRCYTKIIEPVSLDEAYLDVTNSKYCNGDPDQMARQIRQKIFDDFNITASAGISSNKFLAKLASEWHKPNGQFSIYDDEIKKFIISLPIRKIHGVGKITEEKLVKLGIKNCRDLQNIEYEKLVNLLGKFGIALYYLCRGIDDRVVEDNKVRKSLSVEDTYINDLISFEQCLNELKIIYEKLIKRLQQKDGGKKAIKACFIKIKYSNFKVNSSQILTTQITFMIFHNLLEKIYNSKSSPIRLLGVGVKFDNSPQLNLNIY